MKLRLDRLISNLGYASRSELPGLIRSGIVSVEGLAEPSASDKVEHASVQFEGQPLDPPQGLTVVLNKPCGYVCSHSSAEGASVYALLPERWSRRKPALNSVGRLDQDACGLLVLTDDGQFLHRLTSPRHHIPKIYEVELADPLRGDEGAEFAAGRLMLQGEKDPLAPAFFSASGERSGSLILFEGRYHQIKRMFAALGNRVTFLKRTQIGAYRLDASLTEGAHRLLGPEEAEQLLTVIDPQQVLGTG
ncbi:MAG: rRNA pseudouridine synthase [Oligoflexia bacterium]|nr:rRNA pseudouridine synthase [Oligoflexia bacterium]